MNNQTRHIITLLLIVPIIMLVFTGCKENKQDTQPIQSKTPPPRASLTQGKILTVGSISNTPKEEIADFQPFVNYLAGRLQSSGFTGGEVVIASSLQEMTDLMKNGRVDLYIDSPFPILTVCEESGAKLFLRRWKKGIKEYNSVIFVRRDSGIESVSDLMGKFIAFEEEFSTAS
ncbi:MAG: PhnD/SsuA/transferrin family substrate-binding protein [Sedimentisphaerales bacterium]|nr:PhnD/SsuA/transferrin family substrate-binding protein [Sedimentisphaerales bacterium]